MLRRVDAAQALADLTEISSQVVHAAIVAEDGAVLATTIDDEARIGRFVRGVADLLAQADVARQARGLADLAQLEAATLEGSVFVVRRSGLTVAATTRPDPTVGLVFYDLKHCLRSLEDGSGKPAQSELEAAPAGTGKADAAA
jgi:predicted regulator of Ras-like GTPase activity (Roadblock/LC7/MglB family)